MNIERTRFLKEFLMANPPDFQISDKCCNGAKKRTAHAVEKKYNPDLNVQGVRKSEGGCDPRLTPPALIELQMGVISCDQSSGSKKKTK